MQTVERCRELLDEVQGLARGDRTAPLHEALERFTFDPVEDEHRPAGDHLVLSKVGNAGVLERGQN